jgi:hypothetical protein
MEDSFKIKIEWRFWWEADMDGDEVLGFGEEGAEYIG